MAEPGGGIIVPTISTAKIYSQWVQNCHLYEDKSIEWLLQFTADQLEIEVENVVDAMINPANSEKENE
jgi:hypothetical protein